MQVIEIRGEGRESGKRLGAAIRKEIRKRISLFRIPDAAKKNKDVLLQIHGNVNRRYPNFVQELNGLAEGSGSSYQEILLLNCLEIIDSHGCSSFAIKDKGNFLLAHNEDADSIEEKFKFPLVRFIRKGMHFTSFIYPGELPGSAYSWTSRGIAIVINNLRQPKADLSKIPRVFTARAVLESSDIENAIDIIKGSGDASGYHYFIMDKKSIFSIEQSQEEVSALEINGSYCHTNHYLHSSFSGKFLSSQNSEKRLDRLKELLKLRISPEKILFDKENRPSPLYNKEGDMNRTISTVIFRPGQNQVNIYETDSEKSRIMFPFT